MAEGPITAEQGGHFPKAEPHGAGGQINCGNVNSWSRLWKTTGIVLAYRLIPRSAD